MMGSTHAATGAVAGALTASAAGAGPGLTLSSALVCAGAALVPDLDHGNSCATLAYGPATKQLHRGTAWLSLKMWESTRTDWERRAEFRDAGRHRYLTHTGLFAVFAGALGFALAEFDTGRFLVVLVMVSFALRGLSQALRSLRWLDAVVVRTLIAAAVAFLLAPSQTLTGVLVGVGCLAHIAGDSLTRAGVPLLWPRTIRGQRWCRLRTPLTVTTGDSRFEAGLRWLSLAATPGAVFLL